MATSDYHPSVSQRSRAPSGLETSDHRITGQEPTEQTSSSNHVSYQDGHGGSPKTRRTWDESAREAVSGHRSSYSTSPSSPSSSSDEVSRRLEKFTKKHSRRSPVETKNYPKKTNSAMPYHKLEVNDEHVHAHGKVSKSDGRLKLNFLDTVNTGWLNRVVGASIKHRVGKQAKDDRRQKERTKEEEHVRDVLTHVTTAWERRPRPKLNIVVMVIGSRGDIQPFIKISRILKEEHGHRVRIATHPAFKDFVEKDCGLEFFSVGGNPSELMAFMVKNPGLIPSMDTVKEGEIGRRRDQMSEMFEGFWKACVEPEDEERVPKELNPTPFIADLIIANPPSFAHVHCAERLGCPLHIIFTFPYTPTTDFPHPLANIQPGHVDSGYTNFVSYPLVEMMTWQGLGDLVNRFRVKTLGLEPVSTLWAPGQLYRLKVPYTYLWSPKFCPKPKDWGPEIDIAGFVFLDLASSFEPPDDLAKFIEDGDPPIYIGFGSIVVDDAERFTKLIFDATAKAGVRALVNKGWGGLGDEGNTPDHIFMLGNTPHDWLFPRCKAVVHHGGAGTTAIGLKLAKPTMIVPFFGDQPFWADRCFKAGVGPEPVPYKQLTVDRLADGIKQCLTEEAQRNVQKIADSIEAEGDGAANAVNSVLASLPWHGSNSIRCSILEERAAVWRVKDSSVRLSALAAEMLVTREKISYKDLRLLRLHSWNDFQGPGAPISGTVSGVVRSVTSIGKGFAKGPVALSKDVHQHAAYEKKKHAKRKSQDLKPKHKQQSIEGEQAHTHTVSEESSPDSPPAGRSHSNTLPDSTQHASKVAQQLEDSKSQSPPPLDRADSSVSTISGAPPTNMVSAVARDAALGITAPLSAIAQVPTTLLMSLGLGLHNAPRLYGDSTVRHSPRIDGIKSGLGAAVSEFALGTYDAFTGVVTQPIRGAKEDGIMGAMRGVGKGLGGLALKQSAAVVAPMGMVLLGVQKEITKNKTPVPGIRAERVRQGTLEAVTLHSREDGQEAEMWERVQKGWEVLKRLWSEGEKIKASGVGGRWRLKKEKRAWQRFGASESTEVVELALEARKKGIPFEVFMEGIGKDGEVDADGEDEGHGSSEGDYDYDDDETDDDEEDRVRTRRVE